MTAVRQQSTNGALIRQEYQRYYRIVAVLRSELISDTKDWIYKDIHSASCFYCSSSRSIILLLLKTTRLEYDNIVHCLLSDESTLTTRGDP